MQLKMAQNGSPSLRARWFLRRVGFKSPSLAPSGRIRSLGSLAKMFFEELSGTFQALFREHYRLG